MSYFQSAAYPPEQWQAANREAISVLKQAGAVLPEGFYSTGVPQLTLADRFQKDDQPFDFGPFQGRLIFHSGCGLNSGGVSPFPHGPVRLTLVRWGTEPDQCGRIEVGPKTELSATSIVSQIGVTIGSRVLFGPGVVIMDCDGHAVDRRLPDLPEHQRRAPVRIEDHAWIGMGALIMKGVTVGHHAVVAAHAVVTRDVPPHGVVAGNPARLIKTFGTPAQ
ncbi:MAG TPA: acyltransferase [Kiritimatiellia bacterium]|nr:acyltransferase [Kiritimatiellia bacterium]